MLESTKKKRLRNVSPSKSLSMDIEFPLKDSRYISIKTKRNVIQRQMGKCNNSPFSPVISGYDCPFWKWNKGCIDSSGLEFDHIQEWSITKDNTPNNIQGLCVCCHKVKTTLFLKSGKEFTSIEMMNGKARMDTQKITSPKKHK